MNRKTLVALLALTLCAPLLPGCGRDKGSATPQAAQELAELRAEQEQGFAQDADSELQAEILSLLSRFEKTADATLRSSPHQITLLHLACLYKKTELARCLLLDGADVNARQLTEMPGADVSMPAASDTPGLVPADTPLTWATLPHREGTTPQELLPLIELLVKNGADVNQPGPLGLPPLLTATVVPSPAGEAVVLRLLELGADARAPMPQSLSNMVAANGWHKALTRLLDAGCPIENPAGSALHAAADNAEVPGALECARLLLKRGAEVDAQNNEGATPLYIAAHALTSPGANDPELLEATADMLALLLQHGADPLRCSDADPEFPGSCAADFIAMNLRVQDLLAARGITVPRRSVNWEAEGETLLAEICRASLFGTPAEEIAPHFAMLAAVLSTPPQELEHSPLFPDAFSHAVRLLARADAARTAELLAQLPLWRDEEAWLSADARTASLMEAILATPELILPRAALLEHARRLDAKGVSEVAALLAELLERDAEAGADIEALCADASPALRAGALTARLLTAGLPAPRNAAVAQWMELHRIAEEDATPALRRALLLTSLEKFWYGDMSSEEVRALLQAMRDIGAPQAADFYAELAANLSKPEVLDELMAPGGRAEAARFELESATALFLWSQREELQKLRDAHDPAETPNEELD